MSVNNSPPTYSPDFFIPILYEKEKKTTIEEIHEAIEDYCHLFGRHAYVVKERELEGSKDLGFRFQPVELSAAKVISLVTLIIPLFAFIIRSGFRWALQFHVPLMTYAHLKYPKYGIKELSDINDRAEHLPLLDALLTGSGCDFGIGAFFAHTRFTDDIRIDIGNIVRHNPNLLNKEGVSLSIFSDLTPFAVACMNPNIPLDLIQFLVDQGADTDCKIKGNYSPPLLAT